MKKREVSSLLAIILVIAMFFGFVQLPSSIQTVEAADESTILWDGAKAASVGNNNGEAVFTGTGVSVTHDTELSSDVLTLTGEDGYLELPSDLWANVTDGFTIAYKVKPASDAANSSNIFQSNLSGYGTGDSFWVDAPEISFATSGLTTFYIGGRTINGVYNPLATYNNGVGADDKNYAEPYGHKVRYSANMSIKPEKNKWNDVVISVSKTELKIYINGVETALSPTVSTYDIKSNLEYLFGAYTTLGDNWIQQYKYNSIGNSVYSNIANFKGSLDNLKIYTRALSAAESKNLPSGAEYDWTFEESTISESDIENYVSDPTKYMGETDLTKIEDLTTYSPDGNTEISIWKDAQNKFYYSVIRDGFVVIESSAIGIELVQADLTKNLTYTSGSSITTNINEEYDLISGKKAMAVNQCTEREIVLKQGNHSLTVVFRAYDDGIAFRYKDVNISGAISQVTVNQETSEFLLSDKATTWAFKLNGTYEGEFVKRTNKQLVSTEMRFSTPILASVDKYWVLFSEANVFNNNGDYCSSALKTTAGTKNLVWDFGDARDPNKESTGDLDSPGHIEIETVTTRNGFQTPWRVAIISDDLDTFYNSDLIYNLNPSADETLFADTSWIKPGKVAWSWWAEDAEQGNYDKHIEYIDFASENGWEYVCLDVGWLKFEDRLSELCAYAKTKNVGIFVWINYRDMTTEAKVDEYFTKWKQAGIVGLKTDYFESDEQSVLKIMEYTAKKSAELQLMILYHGSVRPAGEYKTYPNILTMEAVQGEEWHKWMNTPTIANCLMYPFTRNILGSMDYTPVGTKVGSNEATFGFGIAQTVVYESGLQHLANAASLYKTYNGLSFLNNLPTVWSESTMLEGDPGKYVTFARKNQNNWFIGAMTLNERTAVVPLDFLDDGEYNAYIYGDNADGTQLVISEQKVSKSTTLTIPLLDAGGVAIMITKDTIDTYVAGSELKDPAGYTYYEAESKFNTLSGTAVVAGATFCSGAQKVGFIGLGSNNTLQFNQVNVAKAGYYNVNIYYCTGLTRKLNLRVNGKDEYTLTNLNSGSFSKPAVVTVQMYLKAGNNTILLYNNSAYAPDIDRIAVANDLSVIKVSGIKLNADTKTLVAGTSFQLNSTVSPASASNKSITYSSSDTKTAKVSGTGKITAIKAGKATIKATAADGSKKYASCTVTVKAKVSKVTLTKNNTASNQSIIYLAKGKTLTLTAKVSPANAIQTVKWTSSKPSIVSVSNKGKIKAKKTGTAIIKAAATSNNKKYKEVKVVVTKKALKANKIQFNAKSYKVKVGKTITLKTTISPKKSTDRIKFSSDNKKVAKVNSKTGVVTGIKKGTANITVTTTSGRKVTVKVKVSK